MSAQKKDELIKFVEEKCESKKVLILIDVAREFKEKSGSDASVDTLRKAIRRYSMEEVPKIQDQGKRVKQLFALSVKIEKELLETLETHANVVLDSHKKIVKYEAKDGSLTLEGDQSHGRKMKHVQQKARMAATVKKEEKSSDSKEDSNSSPPPPKRARAGPSARFRGDTSEVQQLSNELMEANEENARLENLEEQIELKDRMIAESEKIWRDDKEELIQKHADELSELKLRHENEMTVMKQKLELAEAQHGAKIKQLKTEAAKELARAENFHQKNMEQMKKETEKSVQLLKNREAQINEKEINLLEKRIKQRLQMNRMMLNNSGSTHSAPKTIKEMASNELKEANEKNVRLEESVAQLEKTIEVLKKGVEESNIETENSIGHLQGEIKKRDAQIVAFSSTSENYRKGAAQNLEEKQQLEVRHKAEVESLKIKAADDMKKMEDEHRADVARFQAELTQFIEAFVAKHSSKHGLQSGNAPTSAETVSKAGGGSKEEEEQIEKESSEVEALKKENEKLKHMIEESDRIQKEKDEKNAEEKAKLQKRVDLASHIMTEATRIFGFEDEAASTANVADGFVEQPRDQITEEIEEEAKNAEPKETEPVEENKNEMDEDDDSA